MTRRSENTPRYSLSARMACLLVASAVGITLSAATVVKRPALVVNIMVDGMSMQSIEMLRGYFGQGGFNRLLNNGLVIEQLEYGSPLDASAATAVIQTGASPCVNGIDGTSHYDPETRRVTYTLHDPEVMGNYTDATLSAASLLTSTIGDELRIDTGGLGYVYAIAPDATQAVVMAGHAGNSGVWLDNTTGRWASSTYYSEMPAPVVSLNRMRPLSARLDTLVWTPSREIQQYPDLPSYKRMYPFRQSFPSGDTDRFKAFAASAPVNTEVTDIAGDYLRQLSLGTHEGVDMLSLAYTLQPYTYGRDPDTRAELIDSYIKLDSQLARLFNAIDTSGPGMANTLVVVAGTPVNPTSRRDDPKWRIPGGKFSPRKAASLLNMYLMAIHGNGEWVNGIHDGHVYLNRRMIKERDKDLTTLRRETADFMTRLSGVVNTLTIDDITARRGVSEAYARNIDASRAGDVIYTVTPGWEIDTENENTPQRVERANAVSSSAAMICGPGVASRTIAVPVDARAIAPTVCSILRIRSPNAASQAALRLSAGE